MTAAPVRVAVVDDEAVIRRGLRLILDSVPDLEVVAEGVDGRDAVTLARSVRPDVMLLDVRMPVMDGLAATPSVVAAGSRVLVLTTYDVDENLFRALQAGASGFLLKTADPDDLVHAVRVVARGDAIVEPTMSRRLLQQYAEKHGPTEAPGWVARLTAREREVLDEVVRGLSNAEICAALQLSEGTVKTHVASVLTKLGVRDRLQAVILAYESGYVRPH
jgi:DNA-binding NarL/FixJ family response regulator